MALFKLGAFADYLSGKSGNTVFARTKSGTVVRDRVIPTNSNYRRAPVRARRVSEV